MRSRGVDPKQVRARFPPPGLSSTFQAVFYPLYCASSPAPGERMKGIPNQNEHHVHMWKSPQMHFSWYDLHLPSPVSLAISLLILCSSWQSYPQPLTGDNFWDIYSDVQGKKNIWNGAEGRDCKAPGLFFNVFNPCFSPLQTHLNVGAKSHRIDFGLSPL